MKELSERKKIEILKIGDAEEGVFNVIWSHRLLKAPKESTFFFSRTMYVGYELKYLADYKESFEVATEPGIWMELKEWWGVCPEEIKVDIIKMIIATQIIGEARYYTRSRILS